MILDYEQKYNEALERARIEYKKHEAFKGFCEMLVYIFPELKEGEDEKMWKLIKKYVHYNISDTVLEADHITREHLESWLEKQGEHTNFRNKIQIGDEVIRNEDGVLVNISQLNRVAKKEEKQGEQKPAEWHIEDEQNLNACLGHIPDEFLRRWLKDVIHAKYDKSADKVEPKFKVGDWVVFNNKHQSIYQVEKIEDGYYNLKHIRGGTFRVCVLHDESLRLWTIQNAKAGDVLATKAGGIFIYKELLYDKPFAYCGVDKFGVFKDCNCGNGLDWTPYLNDVSPATKEQQAFLFQRMKEAGYEWDADKKELKKL